MDSAMAMLPKASRKDTPYTAVKAAIWISAVCACCVYPSSPQGCPRKRPRTNSVATQSAGTARPLARGPLDPSSTAAPAANTPNPVPQKATP